MKTPSASPAEAAPRTLVWDAPVRVFHWSLALAFLVAWLSAESERWQLVHVTAGYTVAGLVAFRLLWGFVGTRYARFASFVRGPGTAWRYLKSLAGPHPEHHTGHNPAGGFAVLALLGLGLATAAAGWATYNELGGDWLEEVHEVLADTMMLVVAVHIAAVLASSLLHHENLVAAMISGRKRVPAGEGIRRPWRPVAALVLAGVLGFWWLQWQAAPAAPAHGGAVAERQHDDED